MDVNELVRTIVREVVKQMQEPGDKDCVMVLAERDDLLNDRLCKELGEEADIVHFGEDTSGRKVSRYILPFLSCSDMADLAAGRASGTYMTEVLNLLLQGTEVETLEFGHSAYRETAPGPLYRLYESYVETLAGFGLKPFQPTRPESVRFWETLVTEEVILDAQRQGASVLLVPTAAQITPLAAEAAKDLSVTIQKSL